MGRSTPISCLKIIACGSDSAGKADLERAESKASTDKRGWSFGKRSGRHRVLSNSVISELPSPAYKESQEAATNDFHAQANSIVPEKVSVSQRADDMPQFSSAKMNSDLPDSADASLVTGNDSGFDCNLQESAAIVIQAVIRGYLAQRALFKHKSAVKLQAAVRGHLVRRQAVGTLRCVQAIVKMQALVRARRVRLSAEGLGIQEKLGSKIKTNNQRVSPRGKETSGNEAVKTCSSAQKLLTNGFARQLLESEPKAKKIRITCDPSKSDSAWKWLERWMSVSSSDVAQSRKPQLELGGQDQGDAKLATSEVGTEVQFEVISESADLTSDSKEAEILLEGEENLVADDFEFQSSKPTEVLGKSDSSAMEDDMEQPHLAEAGIKQEASTDVRKVLHEAPVHLSTQMAMQSDATLLTELDSVSDKLEGDTENSKRTMKRVASEQLETEGKKLVFGSRKSTNPAFAAVQSKFEGLNSPATSGKSISSTYREVAVEMKLDSQSPQNDSVTKTKDISLAEDLVSNDPRVRIGGSECGTELFISSTLNSPDRSEVEGGECVHETGTAYKGDSYPNGSVDNISNYGNLDTEAEKPISMLETTLPTPSDLDFVFPGKVDEVNENSADSVSDVDSNKVVQQQPMENIASDMHIDTVMDQAVNRLSQEGSPRSHMTAPESHGTPSSQVSVKVKGNKSDNSIPTQKRKIQSIGKRSPSQQNTDSVVSSMEHLPKDPKNEKSHNSLDHEPRVSSSSLPSYMQATESARAKAHANNSPKSSPDVHDKDIYIKKRHSLPVTNGKQGSPRIQRSMSQAQQSVKGNGTHSPQNVPERKWQR